MAVVFGPKILGLSVGIFGTVSRSPGPCLTIGFGPGTDVLGFGCVLWLVV